jgi:aryl-alcohol dehydrogenase-like predicted oxidoreductase
MDGNVSRREFVKGAAAVTAGIIGAGSVEGSMRWAEEKPKDPPAKILNFSPNMEYRPLGKTGLMVSAVCMGGHFKRVETMCKPKGEVNPYVGPKDAADMPSFLKNRDEVISKCIEAGINYVDACTAGEILTYAKVLKGRRDKMYLGSSWAEREMRKPDWQSAAKLLEGLDMGLKEAGLEYADVWRITMHEEPRNGQRGTIHTQAHIDATLEALTKAQKAGKVRFVGFSCHDRDWIKECIEKYPEIQVICTPFTLKTREKPGDSLFASARKCGVGIFGIKPFGSNALFKGTSALDDPHAKEDDEAARLAIRYILASDCITAPIAGIINAHQVDNLVQAVGERRKMDTADARKLEELQGQLFARLDENHKWLRNWECV